MPGHASCKSADSSEDFQQPDQARGGPRVSVTGQTGRLGWAPPRAEQPDFSAHHKALCRRALKDRKNLLGLKVVCGNSCSDSC